MFDKINEARRKADEIKTKLSAIQVEGSSGNGAVTVVMDGNKKPLNVSVRPEWLTAEHQSKVEEAILEAMQNALNKAENVSGSEMKSLMASMLPGIGGMFGK